MSFHNSPALITLKTHVLNPEIQPSLSNVLTNWDDFKQLINERLTLNISLKTEEDTEATVKFLNNTIQWAGCNATPEHTDTLKTYGCLILKKQSKKKRRLHRGKKQCRKGTCFH
jgi:hypothetical protein